MKKLLLTLTALCALVAPVHGMKRKRSPEPQLPQKIRKFYQESLSSSSGSFSSFLLGTPYSITPSSNPEIQSLITIHKQCPSPFSPSFEEVSPHTPSTYPLALHLKNLNFNRHQMVSVLGTSNAHPENKAVVKTRELYYLIKKHGIQAQKNMRQTHGQEAYFTYEKELTHYKKLGQEYWNYFRVTLLFNSINGSEDIILDRITSYLCTI